MCYRNNSYWSSISGTANQIFIIFIYATESHPMIPVANANIKIYSPIRKSYLRLLWQTPPKRQHEQGFAKLARTTPLLSIGMLNLRGFSLPARAVSYIAGLSQLSHETHLASPIPSHGLYIVLIIAQPQIHASSLLVTVSSLSNTVMTISQSILNIYT